MLLLLYLIYFVCICEGLWMWVLMCMDIKGQLVKVCCLHLLWVLDWNSGRWLFTANAEPSPCPLLHFYLLISFTRVSVYGCLQGTMCI